MNYGIRRRGHRLVEAATFKKTPGETDRLDSGAVPAWIDVRSGRWSSHDFGTYLVGLTKRPTLMLNLGRHPHARIRPVFGPGLPKLGEPQGRRSCQDALPEGLVALCNHAECGRSARVACAHGY